MIILKHNFKQNMYVDYCLAFHPSATRLGQYLDYHINDIQPEVYMYIFNVWWIWYIGTLEEQVKRD